MKRIVLSLLIVLGVFTGATAQKANMDARKLQLALFAISNLYVDSTSETKLVEDAIVGMLDKLDPHSNYMDPEETKEMTGAFTRQFRWYRHTVQYVDGYALRDSGNPRRSL